MNVASFGFMQCIDEYRIVDSDALLWVYSVEDVSKCQWMSFDDLDFFIDERLSSDELAYCLFLLTGGSLNEPIRSGKTGHFYIHYDESLPGLLGLETKSRRAC